MDDQVRGWIAKLAGGERREALLADFEAVRNEGELGKRAWALERVKNFFLQHGSAVGDSVTASVIYEYLKSV